LFTVALTVAVVSCGLLFRTVMAPPMDYTPGVPLANQRTQQAARPTATPVPPEEEVIDLPTPAPALEPTPEEPVVEDVPLSYYTQSGDTLEVIAKRFDVDPSEITSPDPFPGTLLLNPGQLLFLPNRIAETSSPAQLLPDSEVIFSPSATDLNIKAFIIEAGGYLSTYGESLGGSGWTAGYALVERVAVDFSVNPRLLLSLLEYQSHWVYGQPANLAQQDYPLGKVDLRYKGLYNQLAWAISQVSLGYYGWRDGSLTNLTFPDKSTLRLAPDLNAGTVALQYFFASLYPVEEWASRLYGAESLPSLHEQIFGPPWERAQRVEPLFSASIEQPELALPFAPHLVWSLTGGPHAAWGAAGALAALDFAPGSTEHGCVATDAWVWASATGLVVRSERGAVVVDLDGDGFEQTGWVIIYMHISTAGRAPVGTWLAVNDPVGHPSCEGGFSTGTHVHIVRKYNGEWILADGSIPFVLSGWTAHNGSEPYQGYLTREGDEIIASQISKPNSYVIRD
jgi:hypothetical protein